ncbi:MAG: hypothetical protein Q9208_002548 [Pyrenodesmia sp. 3 TL-2023]
MNGSTSRTFESSTSVLSSTGSLSGRVAIVTGGSRGIGAAIAQELAKRGAKVAITYTSSNSERGLDGIIQEIEALDVGSAIKIKADLRSLDAPRKIVKETQAAFGEHIDILVNNAGTDFTKPLLEITSEDFTHVYSLNVLAVLLMAQAVIPYLRSAGRIINIGSVAARGGFPAASLYCSSKAAVEGLSRVLAAELGSKGHTVNTVNPGPVRTEMLERIPQEWVEMQKSLTPMEQRVGTTDDVAQVVAFLAEEGSRWITGQAICASGGWAMY